jgi:uncharacterized protein YkwD
VVGLLIFSFSHSYANPDKPQVLSGTISSPAYSNKLLQNTSEQINQIRLSNNLKQMTESPALDKIAVSRAQDMAHNHYYAHLDSTKHYFDYYLKSSGYKYSFSCENLNLSDINDANVFVDGWMNSTGHKDCILKPSHKYYGYGSANIEGLEGSGGITEIVVVAIYSD